MTSPTGSLISNLMLNGKAPTPEVGMGATVAHWSDRDAGTIVEVVHYKSGPHKGEIKGVLWQRDKATRCVTHGMSDAQSYNYERQPDAPKVLFTMRYRKRDGGMYPAGYASKGGDKLIIGVRDEHYDHSF